MEKQDLQFEDNYKLGPMSTGKYISHSENYESCS